MGWVKRTLAILTILLGILYGNTYSGEASAIPTEELQKLVRSESQLVRLNDGRTVEFTQYGDTTTTATATAAVSSKTFVLLHGISCSCHMLRSQAARFASKGHARVVSVSLPGWGGTSWQPGMDVVADDILAVLKFLNTTTATHIPNEISLIGVSMGSMFAQMAAPRLIQAGVSLQSLYLVAPGVPGHPQRHFPAHNAFAWLMSRPPMDRLMPYYVSPYVNLEGFAEQMIPKWRKFCYEQEPEKSASTEERKKTSACVQFIEDSTYASSISTAGNVNAFQLIRWQPAYLQSVEVVRQHAANVHVWYGTEDTLTTDTGNIEYLAEMFPMASWHRLKGLGHMDSIVESLRHILASETN